MLGIRGIDEGVGAGDPLSVDVEREAAELPGREPDIRRLDVQRI